MVKVLVRVFVGVDLDGKNKQFFYNPNYFMPNNCKIHKFVSSKNVMLMEVMLIH